MLASMLQYAWVVILLALPALLLLIKVTLFVLSLFAKRGVPRWHPQPPERWSELGHHLNAVAQEARELGFQDAGLFSIGRERFETLSGSLLSSDGLTLLQLQRGVRINATRLLSQMQDGKLLLTADQLPETDLSGLVEEESIPSKKFKIIAEYHEERLRESGRAAVPWNAATVAEDLHAQALRQVEAIIESGLGYKVAARGGTWAWRTSVRGAWRVSFGSNKNLSSIKRGMDLAKARETAAFERSAGVS